MTQTNTVPQTSPNAVGADRKRVDQAIARSIDFFRKHFIPATANVAWQPSGGAALPAGGEKLAPGEGGYWVGELEADTTLESDYIIFLYFLDTEAHSEKIRKLANTIREEQLQDGSWNIHCGGPGEVSASVKAYFALKIAGHSPDEPFMVRAREAVLRLGGAEKVNTFTKLYLTFLKQLDWDEIPAVPPEVVLLPRFFAFNIYEISYWSRAILIPLSVLYALKPNRPIPEHVSIKELFKNRRSGGEWRSHRSTSSDPSFLSWRGFFFFMDRVARVIERMPIKPLRRLALKRAEEWMVGRSEDSDGLGAIFPSMVNSVMALKTLGHDESHPSIARNLQKLSELEIEDGDTIRLQPCLSPVWDTALAVNALREAGLPEDAPEVIESARWLLSKEVRKVGDWQYRVKDVEVSGWYFQFANEFYPDIDDTAAVLLALDRTAKGQLNGIEESIGRGVNWILSMQSSNGGWAAFDVDVVREALTHVPYADHNAMLDPPCPDITGRILEALARFKEHHDETRFRDAIRRGVEYIKREQKEDGSWYGRWGVNYVYGTWQSLKGLLAVGEDPHALYIRRGVEWLIKHQNADGGWGEDCSSYKDASKKGIGASTASQTAWAVMALVAAGEATGEAVSTGVRYLLDKQLPDGTWADSHWTGTGFPDVFYLKYHLYAVYFPLFALGHYRNVLEGVSVPGGGGRLRLPMPGRCESEDPLQIRRSFFGKVARP